MTLLVRHGVRAQTVTLQGEEEQVAPAMKGRLSFNPTPDFHFVKQLTDVAFGNQQSVGEFLLRTPLAGADLGEHIELRDGQAVGTKGIGGTPVNLLEHARQTHPGRHAASIDLAGLNGFGS